MMKPQTERPKMCCPVRAIVDLRGVVVIEYGAVAYSCIISSTTNLS
jgi:hypothetical protein